MSQRAIAIGTALSQGFGKALSEVFKNASDLKRAYEFFANSKVTFERLIHPHHWRTAFQRSERLTEAGIHRWWKNPKAIATIDQWELIHDVTFHDLRHDFAHRSREAGWTLENVAYYLGHITKKGTPAL